MFYPLYSVESQINHDNFYYNYFSKIKAGQRVMFRRRKDLFERRLAICQMCLAFAAFGLTLAVAEAELTASARISRVFFLLENYYFYVFFK